MNCPHCNQSLPNDYSASTCSFCGRELTAQTAEMSSTLPSVKISWLWFWVALTAPPILTLLSACLATGSNQGLSPAVALFGAAIGGTSCGIIIGLKQGRSVPARIGMSLICSAVLCVVSLVLCFFGCTLGGYHLDMK